MVGPKQMGIAAISAVVVLFGLPTPFRLSAVAVAENTVSQRQGKTLPPQFQPPEVDESLPHVLLIGDSISIGYMLDVRKELAGQANVWRPPVNCGPTTRGLESLDDWLADREWDVIHFNFGLHDLKYIGPKGQNLADPNVPTSTPQVAIDQYAENIRAIAQQLKATGAVIIWRQTTPVPVGAQGRVPGDSKRYNQAAAKAIAEVGGIQTDPIYDFAVEHSRLQKKANVHYTAEGSAKLAAHVAKSIRAALPETKNDGP